MGERARLTVVVITKNEEARIARCLESARWADEIIVVDGMSTDRTAEICRRYGARVIPHAFEGSFAQERNLGLDHAQGEWVLQLDADDVVTPEFRDAIKRLLANPTPHAAFKFRRKSYLLGRFMRFGGWYHELPNLVRRGAVRYEGLVHERPVMQGTIGELDADIEHHPCENLATFIDRHNRYTTLSAQELERALGPLNERHIRARLLRKPLKGFWKSYVKKQGFRAGLHGLVFGLFYAGVEFLKWAKCWERCVSADRRPTEPAAMGLNGSVGRDALPRLADKRPRPCAWPFIGRASLGNPPAIPPPPLGGVAPWVVSVPPRGCSRRINFAKRNLCGEARKTLSVVMMTKNEEARLPACLDRVAGWADEIVIIDDLSTDRTVELAHRYTQQVFSCSSEDNHDQQWNRGIERATGEWILHIDADEIVTPQLRSTIDRVLVDDAGCSAFEMMRKNFFLGHPMRYGGWYHRHLVLFKRDRARCQGNGIHVQLRVDGKIGFLDAEIEHYPFASIAQFVARQNHYTTVESRRLFERQGGVPTSTLVYQLCWRPMKLFWKSYVRNKGRREGMYGLVFAGLYAWTHMMFWAKYWELTQLRPAGGPDALKSPAVQPSGVACG